MCEYAQGSGEELEEMIPQNPIPRLRRCGYCLLQVGQQEEYHPVAVRSLIT